MNKRTFKQRIAYVLALVMMLSVCNNVWATELQNQMAYNESVTNGQTTTSSAIQEGEDTNLTTEQGIHIIKTEEELKAVGEHLDWEYQLANDIDLEGEEWIPIGSEDTPFTGAFDGNGYEISNFQINQEDEANIGFFGVAEDVELINIKLSKYEIVGADYTGALVGKLTGEDNLIKKCQFIKGKISGETNVGGITGYMENTTLSQSYVTGSVTGGYYIGGIVGMSKYNKITNVFNLSDVSGNNYVGGIIGKSTATTTLENSYAAGAVSGQSSTIGGLYGQDKKITVTNCYYDQIASTLTANTDESRLTAELRREATYENWDFNTIWDIDEDVTYPYLYELEKPDGIEKEVTIQGSGTEADPYIIRTTEQLLQINNNLGAHYKLGDDIDLGGMTWTPLGTTSMPFTGTFDGDEHTISNFVINDSLLDYVGLFGVTNNATIKNVTLDQASVAGRYYVGGLIGLAQGANKSIVNCHILSGEIIGNNNVGGLIGASDDINSATYFVKDCSTNVSVNGRYNNIGGLIGWYRGSISGCYTMGNVKGGSYEEVSTSVGGLIGNYVGQGSYYNGSWGETHYYSVATISNCYTTGEVTGVTDVGGLVGHQYYGIVTQCAATGSIEGASNVGGLVGKADIAARYGHEYGGYNHAVVWTNNYVLASVKGTNNVGGLLGYTINSMTMTNCYAAGNTTGESNVGGLYGEVSGLTVTSSYYDSVVTPVVSQYNTNIAKLTAAMKIASTFNGWNFESIWDIKEGATYPYLRNLPRFEGLTGGEVKLEGTGTAEDPYIVRTTQQLIDVKFDLNSCYKLGNDLDLAGMTWTPLGTTSMPFTGTFDGDGYTISNFVINDSLLDYVGLFGVTNNATIKNVTLAQVNLGGRYYVGGLIGLAQGANKSIVNCHILSGEIIGNNNVGGLIGASDDINSATYFVKDCSTNVSVNGRYNNIGGLIGWYRGSISGCYTMGNVKGGSYEEVSTSVGGLIGNYVGQGSYYNGSWGETHYYSVATISNCYTTGKVTGVTDVGGLVGHQYYGIVAQCAATGSVEGASNVGGLVGKADIAARYGHEYGGYNHEVVWTNNYTLANVKGTNNVGGLLGYTINSMTMTNCYAAGSTAGESNVGGLYGNATGLTVTSSYYDSVVTPVVSQYNTNIAKLTAAMKIASTFNGWNFESIWDIKESETYPYLRNLPRFEGLTGGEVKLEGTGTAEDPYIVRTTQQLIDVKFDLNSCYKLGNDIDLDGMTWEPLGSVDMPFTGTFDGNGFTISNFIINAEATDNLGLFSVISNASIKNLTLDNIKIVGRRNIGALAGLVNGTSTNITNCQVINSSIKGTYDVGGFIGKTNSGATAYITECFADANVTGDYNEVGGLAGYFKGNITKSHAKGIISGGHYMETNEYVGGFVGNMAGGTVEYCYSLAEVSGLNYIGGFFGGAASTTIRNSFSFATVTGNQYVGGMIGICNGATTIAYSYVAGKVVGEAYVSGLCGVGTNLTLVSSYYDSDINPYEPVVLSSSARFTASMKRPTNYSDWNFEDIWNIDPGKSYPYLRIMVKPDEANNNGSESALTGEGTEENPYVITNREELEAIQYELDAHYVLGNDIDLENVNWQPIGSTECPFTGTLDGANFTISNLKIESEANTNVGLFSVTNNATIKNLNIVGVSIIGSTNVGAIVGLMQGPSKQLVNCHVSKGQIKGDTFVGGLVGTTDTTSAITGNYIVKCSSDVTVTATVKIAGSIVGGLRGTMTGSFATGEVIGGSYVGGLIGYYYGGTVSQCYFTGKVTGVDYVGGLIGYSEAGLTLSVCYATGIIKGNNYVGGLVGHMRGGKLVNCYALTVIEGAAYVGGLVGSASGSTAIVTCYFGGAITATSNFGGLSGIASYIAVTNSYFVESNSVISGGKTVAQMRQIATYAGWDFSSVWNMTEDQTYPYLKVLPIPDGITGELVTETPDGSGTAADPYVIKTVEQLLAVKNDLDAHYRLANDLDLEGIEWNCIGTMDEPFTGVFDGDGHTISNFSIEKVSTNYVGFFGVISNATIKNLTITGAHITGKNYVGTVVGLSLGKTSTIINVHVASGSVKGVLGVGGLVGAAGTVSINGYINIEGCSSDVEVSATGKYVGGLIGYLEGTIKGSYAIGTVQGDLYVGGLVGYSCGCTIENCYSLSVIVGNNYVGGIVGYCAGSTTIITTYFAGQITCKGTIYGGICAAVDNVVITNSYFNAWVAGIEVTGDYGKLSGSLVHAATYVDWDFTTVWGIEEGVGYPYLKDNQHVQVPSAGLGTEENPYLVSTKEQLLAIKYEVNAYYKLVNDIDLGGIEWTPIGDKNTPFGGHFDGQNHTISNFVMTDGNKNYVGFFGAIHNATIINLILADIKVEGNHYVGGLVGTAFGESNHIENCHIQGSKVNGVAWVGGLIGATQVDASITIIGCSVDAVIVGQGNYVGGIIGYMKGSITTSYVTGSVTGGDYVGGLVGYGTYVVIKTSYSLAVVTGQSYVGGIIAGAAEATTITHCYVAGKVIARTTIVGGICGVVTNITIVGCYYDAVLVGIESKFEGEVSKLTGGLRIKATFVGWDFDTVRTIQEGSTYPYLKDLPKPAGVNKPSGGDTIKGTGTKEDPYLISSKADLLYIRYELDAYFKLTCDIDLEGAEWTPIGSLDKPFKGHFDGNGFTISNFVVSQGSSDYVGFFGAVHNAVIINLTLSGMTIEGHHYVGGLVGIVLGNGTYIEGCHIISGHVTGTAWVGGLIGATQVGASVTVVGCAVNVVVIATGNYVGGIAGYIQGTVIRCYTSGSVTGGIYVGGFIGCSAGVTIKTSYSLTTVTGTNYVAGFIGQCIVATTIIDCYVAGKITCAGAVVGIFCGETIYIKASGCYYDGVACGIVVTEGIGTGKLTGSLTNMTTYVGWDFEIVWEIEIGIGYPHLIGLPKPEHGKPVFDESVPKGEGTEEDPYQITNKKQLINVKYELDACYEVMNDIDLEDEEWIPLGVSAEEAFTGTFNGNGYTISNLFIGNLELSSAGLFGVINNAVIKGINLVNANVASSDYVGSLVGKVIGEENYINECEVTEGIIEGERYIGGLVGGVDEENSASYCYFVDCTTNNEVNSSVSYAGGIIGYGKGDITRCIAEDNHVVGNNYVGGIVGYIYGNSTILECEGYSIVEGSSYVGGIAGRSKQISIEGCTTAANVNASRYVGGVVGYAQATTLSTCESIAEVNGTRYVGGLVGYLIGGSLENCQSDAQVTGDSNYGVEVGKKI